MLDADLQRDAEDLLRRIAAARAGGPTFDTLLDEFLAAAVATCTPRSLAIYRCKAKPLRLHFGAMAAGQITRLHAREFVTRRMAGELGAKVGASTAEQELRLAQMVLNAAAFVGRVSHNPISRLRRKRPKPKKQAALMEEHLPEVVAAAPNLLTAVYVVVAFDSGCRRNEVLGIRRDDVNRRELSVIIRSGKGDKYRVVFITQRALDAMDRLPVVLGNPFVFASTSVRKRGCHMGPEYINDLVRDAIVASGVERHYGGRKVRIHGMRRGHATNAVERGVDLRSVQEQLGHEHISTTEEYLESRLSHRRREMRARFDRDLTDPLGSLDLGRRPPRPASTTTENNQHTVEKIR